MFGKFTQVLVLGIVVMGCGSVWGQDEGGKRETRPTNPALHALAEKSLDGRIDGSRITEIDLPALPSRVILPKPPVFRVSGRAAEVPVDAKVWMEGRAAIEKGLRFLEGEQSILGGWMVMGKAAPTDQPDEPSPISVAVTAMVAKAFAQYDAKAIELNHVRKALRYIFRGRDSGGSFKGGALTNYVTAITISALASFENIEFRDAITEGVAWLQENQWDQSEGLNPKQDWFGGAGYGKHGRPDLSNTQFMLDALYDAGMSPDEPAFQRAQAFLARTQNLKATNGAAWAGNDGGFIYTPANGGESMASQVAGEGRRGEIKTEDYDPAVGVSLRSYGSMTYAGFKSMWYAGLSADDIRVRAAFDWIRGHWTFEENPGMGQQGLYYYYHAMARALNVAQQHTIQDAEGAKHNWREELIRALVKRQNEDGSWKNEADRWMEGEPVLATVFAVLALEEALKPVLNPRKQEQLTGPMGNDDS